MADGIRNHILAQWLQHPFAFDLKKVPVAIDCNVFYVNRDALIHLNSHLKISSNDLLMAEPTHGVFVLAGPSGRYDSLLNYHPSNELSNIVCVIQVCLEGQISPQPEGQLWNLCEQFRDTISSVSGIRIVRITTHPALADPELGYESRAVKLLIRHFEGRLTVGYEEMQNVLHTQAAERLGLSELNTEHKMRRLLEHISSLPEMELGYMAFSLGLSSKALKFWRKKKFALFHIQETPNAETGEHTCMILRLLKKKDETEVDESNQMGFYTPLIQGFQQRFIKLLATSFRGMDHELALSIIDPKIIFTMEETSKISHELLESKTECVLDDMKQLEAYIGGKSDYHSILDLVPTLARMYFEKQIPVSVLYDEAYLLLCIGLQKQDMSNVEAHMKLSREKILSLLMDVVKRFHKHLEWFATMKKFQTTLRN